MPYDFEWCVDETSFLLNFNDTNTDQDFTTARIKKAVNRAYRTEINKAMQEGSRKYFTATLDFTWPASQVTLELPSQIYASRKEVRFEDVTDTDPGFKVEIGNRGDNSTVFWKDRKTLQWGVNGPAAEKTIRCVYMARALEMDDDDDEPELIPADFRDLVPLCAAIFLRRTADEAAPQHWIEERDEMRMDFWKHLARGRTMDDEDTIRLRDSDYTDDGVF